MTRPVDPVTTVRPTEPGSTTSMTTRPSAEARPQTDYAVGSRSITVVDESRPTRASPKRGMEARDSRTLRLLILYPATGEADTGEGEAAAADAPVAKGRFPVVEFSHGVTASGPVYEGFLVAWAKAGYVVVAPTFPLTSGAEAWQDLGDYENQPADVSFVLDRVLDLNTQRDDPLAGHLDTESVAVAGHSLGAITTLGFFNSCCRDDRVDAIISISGSELPFAGGNFDGAPDTPLLLAHGQDDKTVPYFGSSNAFASLPGPRALLTFPTGTHSDVIFSPDFNPSMDATTVAFLDLELRRDPRRWNDLNRLLDRDGVANLAVRDGLAVPGEARGGG